MVPNLGKRVCFTSGMDRAGDWIGEESGWRKLMSSERQ